jgi:hypothetical protein
MRYFNVVTKTEAVAGMHSISPPNVLPLPAPNVYFDPLPAGMTLTYDGSGLPNGLTALPGPTVEEQARIDLHAAGVTISSLLVARYLNDRGDPAPLAAIDAAIDLVVISSGLTLAQVSELV